MTGDRAATPAVGKAMEVGLLVLVAALLTTATFGTAVPTYRDAVAEELGDRTLARAATAVDRAAPATPVRRIDRTVRVSLPDRLRGRTYVVRPTDGAIVLDHPTTGVGGRTRLAVPDNATVEGRWRSNTRTTARVTGGNGTVRIDLRSR